MASYRVALRGVASVAHLGQQDSPDPLTMERGKCLESNSKVQKMVGILQACEQRVASKSYTAETCSQEVVDLMEELDHCVGKKAFAKMT